LNFRTASAIGTDGTNSTGGAIGHGHGHGHGFGGGVFFRTAATSDDHHKRDACDY